MSPPSGTPVTTTTPPAAPPPPAPPPPTTVTACVVPPSWTQSESRSAACAAGQFGAVTEGRTASHTYACPEAWDAPVETVSPWSAWTVSSSTCAACPAPSTQTVTDWVSTSSACPSGQQGSITWEYQQSRSRSVSYNCPAGTTSLPPATLGGWSSWSNTGATRNVVNTCATACVAPAQEWRPAPYKGACPAGWSGTGSNWTTGERRTWTCPSPTGSPTNTGWVWDGTGGVFVDNGDCAANCVVPTPSTQTNVETRTGSQTLACPVGQTGEIKQERQEQRTQTRSASCPAPTGSYTWGGWSAWSEWTGASAWTTVSNTCVEDLMFYCECPSMAVVPGGYIEALGQWATMAECEAARASMWNPGHFECSSNSSNPQTVCYSLHRPPPFGLVEVMCRYGGP